MHTNNQAEGVPDGVDARLDNRTGRQRPPVEQDPAVPQQIDGPDLMHQADHARAVADKADSGETVERKGMFSPGGHSLGDDSERSTNDAGQAGDTVKDADMSTDAVGGDAGVAADKEQAEAVADTAERAARSAGAAGATETADAGPGSSRSRTKPSDTKSDTKSASK